MGLRLNLNCGKVLQKEQFKTVTTHKESKSKSNRSKALHSYGTLETSPGNPWILNSADLTLRETEA
jgi:hypothetical protein